MGSSPAGGTILKLNLALPCSGAGLSCADVPFRVPVVLYFPQERGTYQYDQVVRRASVGDSLAALVAGYRPATPPINNAAPRPPTIAIDGTINDQPLTLA